MKNRSSKPRPALQLLDKGVMRLESSGGPLTVPYRLTRSGRARQMRLTINRHNEVVLTLPPGCSVDRGIQFVRTKADWLRRHLARIPPPETLLGYLRKSGFLSVNGGKAVIDWRHPPGGSRLHYRYGDEAVRIGYDPARHHERELKSLLRQFAADSLPRRVHVLAAMHDLPVNKVSVRDQVSRWGSCSAKRNISLNWRLSLLPPEILDYVIWHELAHLIEMNHSDRFWARLEQLDHRARYHDKLMGEETNAIMALGREVER